MGGRGCEVRAHYVSRRSGAVRMRGCWCVFRHTTCINVTEGGGWMDGRMDRWMDRWMGGTLMDGEQASEHQGEEGRWLAR
ncbi:hypothetical protein LZ31DRAFT_550787 [Colletotrichum somersetense]|nr:hypothetical protein LZ31DRAFT_550787 [Colletotrichum somersetense]